MMYILRKFRILVIFLSIILTIGNTASQEFYDRVSGISWNADGTLLAVVYHYGLVKIFDGSDYQVVQTFEGDAGTEIDWNPAISSRLAISSIDYASHIIDVHTGQTVLSVNDPILAPLSISFNSDGSRFAITRSRFTTANSTGRVYIYDSSDGNLIVESGLTAFVIRSLQWSSDDSMIAGIHAGEVWIWDASTGDVLHELSTIETSFIPELGGDVTTGYADGFIWANDDNALMTYIPLRIFYWDSETYEVQEMVGFPHVFYVRGLSLHPTLPLLAAIGGDRNSSTISIVDIETGTVAQEISLSYDITAITWDNEGNTLYFIDESHNVVDAEIYLS